ncbi:hypothetical protein LTR85_004498 [Meristemomyces frigidus]|nr:hypothetical protein LTR85_004498 [Meristemomyces frigidus]
MVVVCCSSSAAVLATWACARLFEKLQLVVMEHVSEAPATARRWYGAALVAFHAGQEELTKTRGADVNSTRATSSATCTDHTNISERLANVDHNKISRVTEFLIASGRPSAFKDMVDRILDEAEERDADLADFVDAGETEGPRVDIGPDKAEKTVEPPAAFISDGPFAIGW